MKIEAIQNSPQCQGRAELLGHMEGKKISRSAAMKAKCYECMNAYIDGKVDCGIKTCPLYPWMPFSESGPRKLMRKSNPNAFGRNKVAPTDQIDVS